MMQKNYCICFSVFLGRGHYFALLWEGRGEMDGEIMVDCAGSYATV